MNTAGAFPLVNFWLLVLLIVGFVVLSIRSRGWSGPANAARIDKLRGAVDINRGNIAGLRIDLDHAVHEFQLDSEQILIEVRALKTAMQTGREIAVRVEALERRVDAHDQHIEVCPVSRGDT